MYLLHLADRTGNALEATKELFNVIECPPHRWGANWGQNWQFAISLGKTAAVLASRWNQGNYLGSQFKCRQLQPFAKFPETASGSCVSKDVQV